MKNSKKKFKNADGSIRHSKREVDSMVSAYMGKLWGMDLIMSKMARGSAFKQSNTTKPKLQRKQRIQRKVSSKR